MKGSERNAMVLFGLAVTLGILLFSTIAAADPLNPLSKNIIGSERGTVGGSPISIDAQAGNVTAVNINGEALTTVWQGYYGNITGAITLENAGGSVFYNWSDASPTGELYVARVSSPTWATVDCANLTHITTEETALGITLNKVDGINETFSKSTHDAFSLGSRSFIANNCSFTTNGYNNAGPQSASWDEVLLYDSTSTAPVFATIIGQDSTAFNSGTVDFETLIPVNTTQTLTTYYFFVELS